MEAPVSTPAKENWREIVAHRPDTLIESVAAFQNHLVLFERHAGLQQICISDPNVITNVHQIDQIPYAVFRREPPVQYLQICVFPTAPGHACIDHRLQHDKS
jgi:hypothetical protein